MSEKKLMKDGLNRQAIQRIANGMGEISSSFDKKLFIKTAHKNISQLELKDRVHHLITALNQQLPDNFAKTARYLQKLPEVWNHGDSDDPLRGFAAWPIIDYVGVYGLSHPQQALTTLEKLTSLFSAEFAVRPFIQQHFDLTYSQLNDWCQHDDEHVRRLASEGSRPRLPWGVRLQQFVKNPDPLFPLFEQLKNDESLYVRRSVANSLNDISKDHPEKVIALYKKWQPQTTESNWILKHATRSLVKQGHPKIFPLLGYTNNPSVIVKNLQLKSKKIHIGEKLKFEIALESHKNNQRFVLDYAIHFMKANGKTSAKIFKLKSVSLNKNETVKIKKLHSFKLVATRKFYPGSHSISIHINGIEASRKNFYLLT